MKDLSVLQAKRYGSYNCLASNSLLDAARHMVTRNISALVVVDDAGYLQGIITRTDLVRACYRTKEWATETVGEHMVRDVVTVGPDSPLSAVMELLIDKHIHRVVAVREENGKMRPVAVLSAADIVYHMVTELE
ncbi:MAG: CBS domain-containing protein [Caldilineaceae bacterium]|nr:CBS domain-containing protein [Caldilineaceae bacterium]